MFASIFTKKIVILYLVFFSTLFSIPLSATVYYVAANGNDGNTGQSSSDPWQTISKLNSVMNSFNPGDQILFKKGDKFIGEVKITRSGIIGTEIIFGSYGTGSLPEITGKKAITNWTHHEGSIYKANFTDTVSHIYVNDKIMTIARYPNSGFLKTDNGNGTIGFLDAALTEGNGYWNGANCRVRTVNWTYETRQVSSFSAGNILFSTPTLYGTSANYGYYLDNKLSMLDVQGEWFQDKSAGKIYFFAPGGVHPNSLNVDGVTLKTAFSAYYGTSNIKVQDLKISGYNNMGIEMLAPNNVTIQRCYINHIQKYAIGFTGSNNIIDNNTLEDNLNIAMSGVYTNSLIKNNVINRTGLIPGYGGNDGYGYLGMTINTSIGAIIEFNQIDSSGYSGISVGKNMIVRNNLISYSCLILNDGSGIDINDADGLQLKNNIITFTIGNVESSAYTTKYGMGIYFGPQLTKNILIQGNTIAHNSYAGINVDNKSTSINNQILDNVLYNNAYSQITFTDFSATSYTPVYSNEIKRNIFYCLSLQQTCIEQQMFHSSLFSDYGNFDSNYYCNPYSEHVLRKSMVYGTYSTKYYKLSEWQERFNEDLASKYSQFSFDQYKVIDTLSSNLITNSRFELNTDPWSSTPSGNSTITHDTNPLLDTGCMKVRWNGIGSYEGMTSGNYMNIVQGTYYSVSLSCVGNRSGSFSTFGRPKIGGRPFLYPRRHLSYETIRRDYSFVFKPDTSDALTRIAFALALPDSLVYIDNVNVYKVSVERIDSSQMSKIFINNTNTPQSISLGGIPYKDLGGNVVSGFITLQPYSSQILISDGLSLQSLNLTALIQGFYNFSSNFMIQDTLKVYLRSTNSPYPVIDSSRSAVDNLGAGVFKFSKAINGINYFISVKHRNSIETWSSGYALFTSNQASYNFTTSSSQAYGNNQTLKGSRYCIYSGDVNQDGFVEAGDVSLIDNDASISITGFVITDLTGDQFVDGSDMSIADNNAYNYVGRITP